VNALTPTVTDPANARTLRDTVRTMRSFALVGGAGFVVESIIMTVLIRLAGWQAWHARLPSFALALLVTWLLNRTLTFPGRGPERRSVEAFFYVAIQVIGAGLNLAVFALCLHHWPQLGKAPVVPLAIGAACALGFNFAASNGLLYARRRSEVRK
jgi:putative flippase GtrA